MPGPISLKIIRCTGSLGLINSEVDYNKEAHALRSKMYALKGVETGVKMRAKGDNTQALKKQIDINDYRAVFDDGVVWDHTNLGRRRDGLGEGKVHPSGLSPTGSDVEGC